MTKKLLVPVFICILLPLTLAAQLKTRYNYFNYNINEGLLQSNVLDIAFDQHNFCWISLSNGLQKFNGFSFEEVPVQPGLPDDKDIRFFRQKNGQLLLLHQQGISQYNIQSNRFNIIYPSAGKAAGRSMIIGEAGNSLYLAAKEAGIIELDAGSYRPVTTFYAGIPSAAWKNTLPRCSRIKDGKLSMFMNDRLYLLSLPGKKLLASSDSLPSLYPYFFENDNSNNEVLFFRDDAGKSLVKYNYDTRSFKTLFSRPNKNHSQSFRGQLLKWDNKNILCYYDQLFVMSDDYSSIISEIVDFKNNSIPGKSSVAKAVTDNYDNLFLVTINNGIGKLIRNSYPISFFGTGNSRESYCLAIYADRKNNTVLAGTYGSGLLVFDTLQNLRKKIDKLPGVETGFSVNAICKNAQGGYLLLVPSASHAYLAEKNFSELKKVPFKRLDNGSIQPPRYFANVVTEDSNSAILQSQEIIFYFNKITNELIQNNLPVKNAVAGGLYKNMLAVYASDQLFLLDRTTLSVKKTFPLVNTGGVRSYLAHDQQLYLGTNKGIVVLDENGKTIKTFNKQNGLPDECIYAMGFDNKEQLWCSTNKGIVRISANANVLQISREDGLQDNEFNTNAFYETPEGEMFFGGVNGINSFFPDRISDYMVDVMIYLSSIKVNDQLLASGKAAWNYDKLELPYDQNLLAFEFIASGPKNAAQYVHQYQMEGVDKEWVQQSGMQPVRYLLPPGRYVFKMYASSYFEKNALPLKELVIVIKPPYWKTWWFISLLILAAAAALAYGVNFYNRNRYRKKMGILLAQQKVQEERERISMELHDSIGAYANAVLYNTELLQGENKEPERREIMKDLRFASKDIITSLRETIWALKQDNYSAQECLLRIRNFVHPFSRYYPTISFKVEGDAPADKELHYSLALNIVRIVQEAVNNAVKYSDAQHIFIRSSIENDGWQIMIEDDGNGFDMESASYGNGISNMKKRAREMSFEVSVSSVVNGGTSIVIKIP